MTQQPRSLFEKVWDAHVVATRPDGQALLAIDRHFLHEGSFHAFGMIDHAGRKVRRPELTFAVADHYVPSHSRSKPIADPEIANMVTMLEANAGRHGLRHFGLHDPAQGIVHVMAPEQGLTLPGLTIVCGDSHHPLAARCWNRGQSGALRRRHHRQGEGRTRSGRRRACGAGGGTGSGMAG